MPKISDDAIFAHGIRSAILDRKSFAEAYNLTGPVADEAIALAKRFAALRGRKLSSLTNEEDDLARLCCIYAQQYEESCTEAGVPSGRLWREDPRRCAEYLRELRLRRWGKTDLEHLIDTATAVPVLGAGI